MSDVVAAAVEGVDEKLGGKGFCGVGEIRNEERRGNGNGGGGGGAKGGCGGGS